MSNQAAPCLERIHTRPPAFPRRCEATRLISRGKICCLLLTTNKIKWKKSCNKPLITSVDGQLCILSATKVGSFCIFLGFNPHPHTTAVPVPSGLLVVACLLIVHTVIRVLLVVHTVLPVWSHLSLSRIVTHHLKWFWEKYYDNQFTDLVNDSAIFLNKQVLKIADCY